MSDRGIKYFPAMMHFELGIESYEVNITNVKTDMSFDSFTIQKAYWGLFTDLKFYNNYILDSYGFEMRLHVDDYSTPFYVPVPVASFFMRANNNKRCFDVSYLIGANVNDFECVPAEGPSHNYLTEPDIFECNGNPTFFGTNKNCISFFIYTIL